MRTDPLLPEKAYRDITGREPSRKQLGRWSRLQRALDIASGDAIWAVIIALEFYDDCFSRSARMVVFWAKIVAMLLSIQIVATILILYLLFKR